MVKDETATTDAPVPLLAKLVYGSYTDEKTKKTLIHDEGVGSPCLKCNSCEGLDYHFWRKMCKSCGCKFEEHDIKVNANAHVEIVYNLLHATDDLSSLECSSSDDEFLESHPLTKDFRKNKEKPVYSKIEHGILEPYEQQMHQPNAEIKTADRLRKKLRRRKSRQVHFFVDKNSNEVVLKHEGTYNCEAGQDGLAGQLPTEIGADNQRKLVGQIPAQDFDSSYCYELSEKEREEWLLFSKQVTEKAIGKGIEKTNLTESHTCNFCFQSIPTDGAYIFVERLQDKTWHPSCFKCTVCKQKLVNEIYFRHEENIYCGRHYGEIFKARCKACDELIFSKEYTNANDANWHQKHFSCFECDKQLGGCNYVSIMEQPYCLPCYHDKVADICFSCGLPIEVDSERFTLDDMNWHTDSSCFSCQQCQTMLTDMKFIVRNETTFCSNQCADMKS